MITPRTRAVCIPNLLGNVVDWHAVHALAARYDLKIIEDSADTLGATLGEKSTGVWSDISVTSFYGSHVINCAGNGGILCLNDEEMSRRAKLLRSWGRSSSLFVDSESIENRFRVNLDGMNYDSKFVFEEIGYNLEPSEIGAAFGLIQLQKLQSNIELRMKYFAEQRVFFARYEDWFILPRQRPNSRTGWLAFPLTLRATAPFARHDMQIFLEKRNIQTRAIMTGNILRQPGFREIQRHEHRNGYPMADAVMRGGVLLACHHGLNPEMLAHVHESFEDFASAYR
jgi:CDP-6-deoxy-D-xylo-4-hexulose-3-dehydrase